MMDDTLCNLMVFATFNYLFGLGMELVGESSQQKKRRITWKKDGLVQTFLDACIHETIKNGREGSSRKAQSWKNVGEELKKKHNIDVDQRQMKITLITLKENMLLGVN